MYYLQNYQDHLPRTWKTLLSYTYTLCVCDPVSPLLQDLAIF